MIPIDEAAALFLAGRRIAVTGVSRSPTDHGANLVYRRLRDRGYEVFAINPHTDRVEGDPAYPDLRAVPGEIEGVVIGTRPEYADATVRECVELGIRHVWMHGALGSGSVSESAAHFGREHGLQVIDGGCPCMFEPTADAPHRMMRAFLMLTGRVPRRIYA